LRAAEQQRADVVRARRRWMREQGLFDPARLVFIETSGNTKMVRFHGRCARGERRVDFEPHGHWKTIVLGALNMALVVRRPNGVSVGRMQAVSDIGRFTATAAGVALSTTL
jgi:hypothetical protein